MATPKEKLLNVEPLDPASARWIRLWKRTYRDPNGVERAWESAERTTRPSNTPLDGIGIVALLDRHDGSQPHILLQKQYRPPADALVIELPAGLTDATDSGPEESAVRELKEETGYVGVPLAGRTLGFLKKGASTIKPETAEQRRLDSSRSVPMWNDPGLGTANLEMVYLSVDLRTPENANPKPALDEGEFIECFSVPVGQLLPEVERLAAMGFGIDARVGTLAEGIELAKALAL